MKNLKYTKEQLGFIEKFEIYTTKTGKKESNTVTSDPAISYGINYNNNYTYDIPDPNKNPILKNNTDKLFEYLKNPKNPINDSKNFEKNKYTADARTVFLTDEWYCCISPTPNMAQMHLLMWSRNPNIKSALDIVNNKEYIWGGFKLMLSFLSNNIEWGEVPNNFKKNIQFGFHMPPSIPRLHMHVLIGNITTVGLEIHNLERWYPLINFFSFESSSTTKFGKLKKRHSKFGKSKKYNFKFSKLKKRRSKKRNSKK